MPVREIIRVIIEIIENNSTGPSVVIDEASFDLFFTPRVRIEMMIRIASK